MTYRWTTNDLKDLEAFYQKEVAPAMRADGLNPECERPPYAWMTENGFSGLIKALWRDHDLTLEREFEREVVIVGAIVNALTRNKISDERLEWFLDNLDEENTFIVPETVAIEGAFNQGHSVYGFEPTNRHREQKAKEVRDIYDRLAAHVEAHYA